MPGGQVVRLKDVARVELGSKNYDTTAKIDGRQSVGLVVFQLPDANALETADRTIAKMDELEKNFPPGVAWQISYETTSYTEESINEVYKTLGEAVLLVACVVLLFLQNWRAALIPLAAVPVAIIGTFAVMLVMGFSLNTLTLFGMVLAIGIVVDDAIVVVEAVEHHLEHGLSAARCQHSGDGAGGGPRGGRRPGAVGRIRALCLYQRPDRPVLPPVRPDDCQLDHHFRIQLADAQSGLDGGAAAHGAA